METLKAKFIKIEIDGITYEGYLQEVKGAAADTATPNNHRYIAQYVENINEIPSKISLKSHGTPEKQNE